MKKLIPFICIIINLFLIDNVYSTVLYQQESDQIKGFVSDSDIFIDIGNLAQYIADDFILDTDSTITDVHWYGLYNDGSTVSQAQFRIQFYNDLEGPTLPVPDPAPFFETTLTANAQNTGTYASEISDYEIMLFSLNPIGAVNLSGGQRYWLSVVETDTTPSDALFFWGSAAGTGMAYRMNDSGNWTSTNNSVAFSLTGSPIPEPTTMLLLGTGLLGLVGLGRKRFSKKG